MSETVNERAILSSLVSLSFFGRGERTRYSTRSHGSIPLAHSCESLVLLRADRATQLERFVTLVDHVRGIGFHQISLKVTCA